MAANPPDEPKKPVSAQILDLMESPLYWTMQVKERLALIHLTPNEAEEDAASLRQQVLTWIKTGIWRRPAQP